MPLRANRNSGWLVRSDIWILLATSFLGILSLVNHSLPVSEPLVSQLVYASSNATISLKNNFCSHESSEYGVLYFAYHIDPARTKKIMANVVESIKSLRKHNSCVNVAVASNHPIGSSNEMQSWGINNTILIHPDDIIEGPEEKQGRQWWTRTKYLSKSPFNYTIQLDSDRTVCGDISDLFKQLESYEFIGVSVGILPNLDNGVMAWKKSADFDSLIEAWKEEFSKQGRTGCDQPPLTKALDSLPGLKAGVMNPTFQAKYIPAMGEMWGSAAASRTLVLHGPAKIVAGNESFCDFMNEGSTRARIALQDYDGQHKIAYSQEECETYLNGKCGSKELEWNLDFNIISRSLYLKSYT